MGVYNDARRNAECVAENDIRCFARNAAQSQKFIHRCRHFSVIFRDHPLTCCLNIFCFVSKEAGRMNVTFEFGLWNFQIVRRTAIFTKEICRDNIYPNVGALCRQNGCDQQLEWRCVNESAVSIGILLFQTLDDLSRPVFFIRYHVAKAKKFLGKMQIPQRLGKIYHIGHREHIGKITEYLCALCVLCGDNS